MQQEEKNKNNETLYTLQINNRVITEKDLTESGIKEIVEQLGKRRITIGIVQRFLNYFKKKINYIESIGGSVYKTYSFSLIVSC